MDDCSPEGSPRSGSNDWRRLELGTEIPSEGYCDQPYVVQNEDGSWVCVMTTGQGREGEPGQHIISLRTKDRGRTWSEAVDVEPADGPEASYAVPLKVPNGRIYCFYNYNADNIRKVRAETPPYTDGYCRRVDSQGQFVFRYSDDGGRSWSRQRYTVPVRAMEIDRKNPYSGRIRFFWNVGRPFIYSGSVFVSLHKIGKFGAGFMERTEGVLLKSPDLLEKTDPDRASWETLPTGEHGLSTPPGGGPIADEQNFVVLSDGSLFCTYRTVDGHPVCTYSRDGGYTFEQPRYMRYDDGRLMKHPRAANFVWKCSNGKYLYWFHNHGGQDYQDRNPAWVCGGVEADGPKGRVIRWSQPEVLLYHDDPYIRFSYPDLIEAGGQLFLTETQKSTARIHELDSSLIRGLWDQFSAPSESGDPVCTSEGPSVKVPRLPRFVRRDPDRLDGASQSTRAGFTLELWLEGPGCQETEVLIDTRTSDGRGFAVSLTAQDGFELVLGDGRSENRWQTEPGLVGTGRTHLGVVVDGGPRLVIFTVNGRVCDGGQFRQFGWGRFSPHLRHANGKEEADLSSAVIRLKIYDRALRNSQLYRNYRAAALAENPQ